jgi:hypothetical protein
MADEIPADEVLFEVETPLGFAVRVTKAAWTLITTVKHPVMAGREDSVRKTLESPDEIRASRLDTSVYLFYRSERKKRWMCAVTKRLDGDGFLITAYPTDAIKVGDRVWPT